jgi:hypothetical protein
MLATAGVPSIPSSGLQSTDTHSPRGLQGVAEAKIPRVCHPKYALLAPKNRRRMSTANFRATSATQRSTFICNPFWQAECLVMSPRNLRLASRASVRFFHENCPAFAEVLLQGYAAHNGRQLLADPLYGVNLHIGFGHITTDATSNTKSFATN